MVENELEKINFKKKGAQTRAKYPSVAYLDANRKRELVLRRL